MIGKKLFVKETGITLIVLLLTFLIAYLSPSIMEKYRTAPSYSQNFVKGTVIKLIENNLEADPYVDNRYRGNQIMQVRIDQGELEGKIFTVYNTLDSLRSAVGYEGLQALFTVRKTDDGVNVWLYNYNRTIGIYILVIVFFTLVMIIGKREGLHSILSLILTATIIVYIVIPGMWTPNPVLISVLSSLFICTATFLIIAGCSRKAMIASIGTVLGIVLAGFISFVMGRLFNLSGIDMEKGASLLYLAQDRNFKVKDILFVSILISSLGATMDISITIASSGEQLEKADNLMSKKKYFSSLMSIGKDTIGTMTNTLILAFCGTSLPLAMMIWGYKMTYTQFINIPIIVINILQALSGSIGMVTSVFFTALISTIFFIRRKKYEKN